MDGVHTAIVGREPELALVAGFLDGVASWPAALLVEGEAGIGKTTVWLEAVREAEARPFRVLQSRPAESETTLSYAALADLVGEGFDETRTLLPPVQERALAAALLRADGDEVAHARVTGTALVGVLTALAEEEPVVLAIDDVQWLDPASANALTFAARRLPPRTGLLLARRSLPGGELPLGLERALADDRVQRIAPGPLTLAGMHQLVRSRLGDSLTRALLTRVADVSAGNPFFALEVAQALVRQREAPDPAAPLRLPRRVEELVATRVGDLSELAGELVLAASSVSRPTTPVLAGALGPRTLRSAPR